HRHGAVLPGACQADADGVAAFGAARGAWPGASGTGRMVVERPARQAGRWQHESAAGHRGEPGGLPATDVAEERAGVSDDPVGRVDRAGDGGDTRICLWSLRGQGDGRDGVVPRTVGTTPT